MIKPLFLTYSAYSSGEDPYQILIHKLEADIKTLYAGDFYHLHLKGPGNNMDFFAEANALIYPHVARALNEKRPVILLDGDNGLVKSIDTLFEADFDVAAVFRYAQMQKAGRQDYCSGLVALNNRRPTVIKKFWIEWTYRIAFYKQPLPGELHKPFFPILVKAGWLNTWFTDQSSLNVILLPDGNQQDPKDDEYKIIPGTIYEAHEYRILPLDRRVYGAEFRDSSDASIIHYKGKTKNQRLR